MNERFNTFFLFVKIRVLRGSTIFLLLIPSLSAKAAEPLSYKCLMRIPIDLVTAEGVRLEKGKYELEIKPEAAGNYVLSFSSDGHIKAVVKSVQQSDEALSSAVIPMTGTHYLHTSDELLLTGEERRFSKTGRAQYEEENRDWKATLRVYKARPDTAFFIVQVRGTHRQWSHVSFRLSIAPE